LPIVCAIPLFAAQRNLIPLLAVLVDAENADVGDMVVAAGVHAAGDVQLQIADVVEVVKIVETTLDRLGDRNRLALASEQKSPPGQQIMSVSRPMFGVASPMRAGELPQLVQIALLHVGENHVLFVADAQLAEAVAVGKVGHGFHLPGR
jgi:hypothetical protein